MTRKFLVAAISLIYMVLGFLNFFSAFFPFFSSDGIMLWDPVQLAGGALALYAGLSMLRFNEFGRKLVVLLLSLRVGINTWVLWESFSSLKNGAGFGIRNDLGEIVYKITSPYAYQGFLLVWIAIVLLTIVFLSQRKTKQLFMPETPKDVEPDIILSEE